MRINSVSKKEVTDLENSAKELRHNILKLVWYMRGGVTLSEAYEMGPEDRDMVKKIVEDNMETTKKSGLPFF